jgi:hypothetical protein
MHCTQCIEELPAGESPEGYARLSVGFTARGLQVVCSRHGLNVLHLDFCGNKVAADYTVYGDFRASGYGKDPRDSVLMPEHLRVHEFEVGVPLDVLRAAVGGYLQLVPDFDRYKGRPCEVWCDEEGLLKGKQLNRHMTAEWRSHLDETVGEGNWDPGMASLHGAIAVVYTDGRTD